MTRTYSQIVKQIESLQRKADSARKKEVSGVVKRIKEAIAFYKLSAGELGFVGGTAAKVSVAGLESPKRRGRSKSKAAKPMRPAKYRDESGNTWGGRGPRPAWLQKALAGGKALQDFAIAAPSEAPAFAGKPARKKAGKAKSAPVPKYRDETGRTWSGRGRKPGWFIAALAQGKAPESMAA
jgi:DNA-binding protein H-NS